MHDSPLVYKEESRVAWLVINREEKRNSLNADVLRLFLSHLDRAEEDQDIRAYA